MRRLYHHCLGSLLTFIDLVTNETRIFLHFPPLFPFQPASACGAPTWRWLASRLAAWVKFNQSATIIIGVYYEPLESIQKLPDSITTVKWYTWIILRMFCIHSSSGNIWFQQHEHNQVMHAAIINDENRNFLRWTTSPCPYNPSLQRSPTFPTQRNWFRFPQITGQNQVD